MNAIMESSDVAGYNAMIKGKKPVIICVDDEQMVLTSLKSQLKRHLGNDYIIETVDSAEEAIEIFNEYFRKDVRIPVVISDQIMPGMKGDEFLKEIHSINNSTLKILLTGQASTEAICNAVNYASLYRYIPKPWEQTDLNLTVSEAVRSYFQNEQLEEQNKLLKEYAETLEQKIAERTKEVIEQKAQLEIKNNDITSSINYASFIQKALLPPDELIQQYLPESFILYKPRDIVSGDFYWFSAKGDKIVMIAADCTGHGVPGGFMSIIGNNALSEIVNKEKIYQPSVILRKLDKRVKRILNQSVTQNNDGMDIAVCVYDRATKQLEFAGANNSLLLVSNGVPSEIKADHKSIGGFWNIGSDDFEFTNHSVAITGKTQCYIYTDGFGDQFGGPYNKKFLRKNLVQLLQQHHAKSFPDQLAVLEKTFTDWKGNSGQIDDVLVFGFAIG